MRGMVKNDPPREDSTDGNDQNALGNLAAPLTAEQETELLASMTEAPTPVPTGITGSWFPALVVLPGQRNALPGKVRVYATPEGLYVYSRVPEDQAQTQQATPFWYAPIAYGETSLPPANYSARAANGFVIATSKGNVTVTVPKGCSSCGVKAMAVWQPVWAHSVVEGTWRK